MPDTEDGRYADRLARLSGRSWKRLLNVQAPYQRNLARQRLGRTLDIGCGIGRNLKTLEAGSIGVDHNERSVALARSSGFRAFTTDEWAISELNQPASFDGLLLAHVVEHMNREAAQALLATHLSSLRPGGKVFFVCPQERGYRSDPTHVEFTSGSDLELLALASGLVPEPWQSFPLPRAAGRLFTYNEFTVLAHKPDAEP